MSELIRIFSALICAVLLYMNIKITGIVFILLIITVLFYFFIKEKNLIYVILLLVFYIYLNLVTYNGDLSGER